jgi:hypothetical protein
MLEAQPFVGNLRHIPALFAHPLPFSLRGMNDVLSALDPRDQTLPACTAWLADDRRGGRSAVLPDVQRRT